ncbi:unnamed protein product [Closterium sp. NIES-64]|nr:unnamed protein product [Closterium sp. NIES-64]
MRTHETRTEGVLDCTGALTVLATKLTAVAYNYQDGLTLLEGKDEGAQAKDEKERKELTEEQRRREERTERSRLEPRKAALVTMPSVLELMGYLFCFGLHMTGPFFEFTAYDDWTRRQGVRCQTWHVLPCPCIPCQQWIGGLAADATSISPGCLVMSSPRTSPLCAFPPIPFRPHHLQIWSAGVKQPPIRAPFCRAFIQGVLSALVFLLVSPSLDLTQISNLHKNRAHPFHVRWLVAHHACIVWRFRAYIVWSITEAAMITAGLGFTGWETPTGDPGKAGDVKLNGGKLEGAKGNGKGGGDGDVGKQEGDRTCATPEGEGRPLWYRARNVDILRVEFPTSCLDFATKWNISYGLWLRLYVYERMVPPGRKPTFVHMLATMFVSAISHGLNCGDFIFFANWALVVASSKAIYQLTAGIPKGTITHHIVALLHTLYSIFVSTYMASAFCTESATLTGKAETAGNGGSEGEGIDGEGGRVWENVAKASTRRFGQNEGEGEEVRVVLYRDDAAWCPFCQRVWLQLEEKRIPYRVEKINLKCYGPKPDWFLELVANGMLPAVQLDGRVITESVTIMKEIEAAFPSHSPLLPPPSDAHAAEAAEQLMGLERGLTGAWLKWTKGKDAMRWLAGGDEEEGEGRREFEAAMDAMEEALVKSGGPYFLGKEFSLVDVTHAPLLERFAASAPYWKGLTVRNNPRWPALSRWYDAMDARPAYLPLKSDDFSITHSLVPQIGPVIASTNPTAVARRAFIDGWDGTGAWDLPLGEEETAWGREDGTGGEGRRAQREVVRAIVGNHDRLVAFCLRSLGDSAHVSAATTTGDAAGAMGAGAASMSSQTHADQAEPQQQAITAECLAPAVSEALRHVAHALLVGTEAAGPFPAVSQSLQMISGGSRSEDVRAAGEERLVMALAYLRDRVGVPRDLSYPAARQLRAHLQWVVRSLGSPM